MIADGCENTGAKTRNSIPVVHKAPFKKAVNLIPCSFNTLGNIGLPVGWEISKRGDNSDLANVLVERDEIFGQNIIKVTIPKEASVQIDTKQPVILDLAKDYVLVVQFKVEDMHYYGHWYYRPAGIRIEAYGTDNKHNWLAVRGEGDSRGWVTGILFFLNQKSEKDKKDAHNLAYPTVMLRCYNMVGTVYFRNPMIVEIPSGFDVTNYFQMEDRTIIFGGIFSLTKQ